MKNVKNGSFLFCFPFLTKKVDNPTTESVCLHQVPIMKSEKRKEFAWEIKSLIKTAKLNLHIILCIDKNQDFSSYPPNSNNHKAKKKADIGSITLQCTYTSWWFNIQNMTSAVLEQRQYKNDSAVTKIKSLFWICRAFLSIVYSKLIPFSSKQSRYL